MAHLLQARVSCHRDIIDPIMIIDYMVLVLRIS